MRNDTFAVLRAGTDRNWGVGIVCGFGTNCSGVSPDGRVYRLPAIGPVSGDWGGGGELGGTGAVARDPRRGRPGTPDDACNAACPAHFGMRTARQVMEALYIGAVSTRTASPSSRRSCSPRPRRGDASPRELVDRQADEIAIMATAAIRKLGMRELDPDVVLGGGIFRNDWAPFFERIADGVHAGRSRRADRPPDRPARGRRRHARAGPARRSAGRPRPCPAGLTHERLDPHTRARKER